MDVSGYGPARSVEEVEAANMVQAAELGPKPVPFGYVNKQWREMLTKMLPGDQLREFSTSPLSWQRRLGRTGVALVRDGREVASIVTSMN